MTGNPAFTAFLARRDQIHKQMENPEVSLKLSDRVGEIVSEKELEKLQDETLDGDKTVKDDPILDETLNILADLVDINSSKTVITQTQPGKTPIARP